MKKILWPLILLAGCQSVEVSMSDALTRSDAVELVLQTADNLTVYDLTVLENRQNLSPESQVTLNHFPSRTYIALVIDNSGWGDLLEDRVRHTEEVQQVLRQFIATLPESFYVKPIIMNGSTPAALLSDFTNSKTLLSRTLLDYTNHSGETADIAVGISAGVNAIRSVPSSSGSVSLERPYTGHVAAVLSGSSGPVVLPDDFKSESIVLLGVGPDVSSRVLGPLTEPEFSPDRITVSQSPVRWSDSADTAQELLPVLEKMGRQFIQQRSGYYSLTYSSEHINEIDTVSVIPRKKNLFGDVVDQSRSEIVYELTGAAGPLLLPEDKPDSEIQIPVTNNTAPAVPVPVISPADFPVEAVVLPDLGARHTPGNWENGLFIQLAALQDQQNLLSQIQTAGANNPLSLVTAYTPSGQSVYRLLMGPFPASAVDSVLEKVRNVYGYSGAFAVDFQDWIQTEAGEFGS